MKTLLAITLFYCQTAFAGGNFLGTFGEVMMGMDARQQVMTPAYGNWQQARNTGQDFTGDPLFKRCTYQTIGGYEFAINARVCPYMVRVNPETNQVAR